MRAHRRSDLVGATLVWLLEVTWGGRVYRFSTYPLVLSSDDGPLSFTGGLGDVAFSETVDRLSASIATAELSVALIFPVDVAQEHRKGRRLHGSTAELSTVATRNGSILQSYEGRVVHLTGDVSQPQYAAPGMDAGWAAFTVVASAVDDVGRFITGSQRISPDTWSDTDDEVVANYGQPYPVIIGTPGEYRSAGSRKMQGYTPAYPVRWTAGTGADYWLIAGHHVAAATVTVFGDDGFDSGAPVTNTKDDLGQAVAVVDVSGEVTQIRNASTPLVGWGYLLSSDEQGGRVNPYAAGQTLRGAGDVLRWALSRSSLPVDHAAFAAAAQTLNTIKIDTYIDDPDTAPWEWVRQLLDILPVSIRRGPRGLYPIVHEEGAATESTAVVSITEGPDFYRVGPAQIESDPAEQATEITVEYVPRSSVGSYARSLTAAGTVRLTDSRQTTTAHSRIGRTNRGTKREALALPLISDEASAASILRRRLRESSLALLSVPYEADTSWGWLTAGQLVALTSSDLYYTDQIAEITAKEWLGTHWRFELLILEDPIRDTRA